MLRNIMRIAAVLVFAFCAIPPCSAGTITVFQPDTTLADLGIELGDFLFTGNTMYDYNGTDLVDIFFAPIDPSQTTSLDGLVIQSIVLEIDSSGSDTIMLTEVPLTEDTPDSVVPEPATGVLIAAGFLLIWARRKYLRRPGPSVRTVSGTCVYDMPQPGVQIDEVVDR